MNVHVCTVHVEGTAWRRLKDCVADRALEKNIITVFVANCFYVPCWNPFMSF